MANKINFKNLWSLDKEICFLNHGSFGAAPKAVLEEQLYFRSLMESEPVRFFTRYYYDLLDESRKCLAGFVGADIEGLGFVNNATTGVNAVLRSIKFNQQDEILVTSQGYGACNNAARFVAAGAKASVKIAEIPFPLESEEEIIGPILEKVSHKTRLAIVDHVTSPTAIIFPVKKIVRELERRGVDVLVDGAHAPGMLDLNIKDINPAYYTGNCHKWMCAPKGAAFLYVREDRRDRVFPAIISHGIESPRKGRTRFQSMFDWQGTFDPTAVLSIPFTIDFMASLLKDGWKGIRKDNHEKVLKARKNICRALKLKELLPDDLCGSMAAIKLPKIPKYPPPTQGVHTSLSGCFVQEIRD